MSDLLTLDGFIVTQDVEQERVQPRAFGTNDINPVDVADKDCVFCPSFCLFKGELENSRIRLLDSDET